MASKLARYRRRRARRNPEIASLTAPLVDRAYDIGAAFGGYAATRVLGRLVYSQTQKRWPGLSRHLAVAASGLGVVGAHFVGQFWKPAAEYEDSIAIGAGVAALQAVAQTYLPARYASIVSDWQEPQVSGEVSTLAASASSAPLALPASPDAELERLVAENSLELHPLEPMGDFSDAAEFDMPEAA